MSNEDCTDQTKNEIINLPQEFVIWGQKTLQNKPTALDRVGIRRMCFYIEKTIRQICRSYHIVNEAKIPMETFQTEIKTFLEDIKSRKGFVEFETELNGNSIAVKLKPKVDAEWITLSFTISYEQEFGQEADYARNLVPWK